MKKNARWDAAFAGSLVAMELIQSNPGAGPKLLQRKLFEVILVAIGEAEQRRDDIARRLTRRRLRPSRN